jgi:hypothetical protein
MTNYELVAELKADPMGARCDLVELAANRLEKATRRLNALALIIGGDCEHEDDC